MNKKTKMVNRASIDDLDEIINTLKVVTKISVEAKNILNLLLEFSKKYIAKGNLINKL